MFTETEKLIIRNLIETDTEALLEIKYDEQVLEFDPTFIKRDATADDIKEKITFWQGVKNEEIYEKGIHYAICLKDSGIVIGVITVDKLDYLYELQIGWMLNGKYARKGYASKAGAAVSDYLLETLSLDYISVVLSADNVASFKTALRAGFKLFEKRTPYDYFYCNCNHENFEQVSAHFLEKEKEIWSSYFYFRKFNPNTKTKTQFYGDTLYDGRFA